MKILISAGEASGDLYASELIAALRKLRPDLEFFGCAGPRMQAAGVRTIVDARSLAVVGLVEVIAHIPRIWSEFRKLVRAAREERPDLAILTDSPDFHLRLAAKLRRLGVPVIYLIAPQTWAWRAGRASRMRRDLELLLCIFPFEEAWFRERGVAAEYIGHPLPGIVRPGRSREAFRERHRLDPGKFTVALLPGSRVGEASRHLPYLIDAARSLGTGRHNFLVALPGGFPGAGEGRSFRERIARESIQVVEGETWDALAWSDVALAASGTVTIEAALLSVPTVTFYRVNGLSWLLGQVLVRVPHYSMVNLVAGREVVPELMQERMTGKALADEARRLLSDSTARREMQSGLAEVAKRLSTGEPPMERAARIIADYCEKRYGKQM